MKKQATFLYEATMMETVPDFSGEGGTLRQPTKKAITFKCLDQCDEEQHDIHFMIMAYFTGGGTTSKKKKSLNIDPQFSREIAVAFVEDMVVLDENFTAADRAILLQDSGALIPLSLHLLPNHVIPFFLELMKSMDK